MAEAVVYTADIYSGGGDISIMSITRQRSDRTGIHTLMSSHCSRQAVCCGDSEQSSLSRCIQTTHKVMSTRSHRICPFLPCDASHSPQRPPQNRTRFALLRGVRLQISLCNIDRIHADRTIAERPRFRGFFVPKRKKRVVVVGGDGAPLWGVSIRTSDRGRGGPYCAWEKERRPQRIL